MKYNEQIIIKTIENEKLHRPERETQKVTHARILFAPVKRTFFSISRALCAGDSALGERRAKAARRPFARVFSETLTVRVTRARRVRLAAITYKHHIWSSGRKTLISET